MKRNDWERFFDGHAPVYMDNSFTSNTVQEVDFILKELKLPLRSCILDMGCETGRHAVELAKLHSEKCYRATHQLKEYLDYPW